MNAIELLEAAVANKALAGIPDRAWSHAGCPFCKGAGKVPFWSGGMWHERDCSYWGGTYRVIERARIQFNESESAF